MRIGIGYDVHPLIKGGKLVLGGINISYPMGLDGHSDADVLVHSIGDALLGAAGKRDIGFFFPNTDPKYKGISSLTLLKQIFTLLQKEGFRINNLDATLVAEEPRLSPYIPQMKENIAQVLKIDVKQIGIKATSSEGLGWVGEKRGISCWAIASIEKM
ncbi:MAG: 2-C-methyl-D-erythritol 2,4-cyclodiphosphate synthase [Candidatus Aerophobetes bacterium]|nr:2-C-methyl-D-erythritol 2,4-cyclodiphosphate synthase [Candidatus Aerophobetes bacterium]